MGHKLGIIAPYRDRYSQLIRFKQSIHEYLEGTDIDYVLIIVEQDNATAFNRGKLLNVGAIRAKELGCDYVVFHDIDMLPQDVDYSYVNRPTHLATNFISDNSTFGIHFDKYFGGVTLFPIEVFEKINGYSNEYWGWGFEDDDLFYRVLQANIAVKTVKQPNYVSSTASLMFNGISSFCSLDNIVDYKSDFSIYISLKLGDLELNHEKPSDKYTIFSVPGYDFSIFYDSFKRYNFQIFDRRGKIHTIVSEITEIKHTKLTVTWDSEKKLFTGYVDKTPIGRVKINDGLFNYSKFKTIFIGCSNRNEDAFEEVNYLKGGIDSFAIYSKHLSYSEVNSLVANNSFGLTSYFDSYESSGKLITYYDPKFIRYYKLVDLSGHNNTGTIKDCWLESTDFTQYKDVPVPFRKECYFRLQDHKPGGYLDGRWKDQLTRYNQLRFINEVAPGYKRVIDDGLNSIKYKVYGETVSDKTYHINVGL